MKNLGPERDAYDRANLYWARHVNENPGDVRLDYLRDFARRVMERLGGQAAIATGEESAVTRVRTASETPR